jgi:hypothetical protein
MQIRAVVTDVDGTLAHADGSVSAATLRAGRELAAVGIPLVAATARTPVGLAALQPEVPAFAVAVCCNGSVGVDMRTAQPLWRQGLPRSTSARIVSILTERLPDAGIAAFDGSSWTLTENYLAIRGTRPRGPSGVVGTLETLGDVFALAVCHPLLRSAEIARHLAEAGITPDDAVVTYASDSLLDIAPPGTGKGEGTARALGFLGIDPADAVAFGDAPNDIPMFRLAGHAVAMGNAHPDALAAAQAVTESVTDDGFSRELHRLGLISPPPTQARQPRGGCP